MWWVLRGSIPDPIFKVSLNIILIDKHFNQCLWVHENFCEALEH